MFYSEIDREQEFARHRLANLPVANMRELRNSFNIIRHSINEQAVSSPHTGFDAYGAVGEDQGVPKARDALHTSVCRSALQRRPQRGPKRP